MTYSLEDEVFGRYGSILTLSQTMYILSQHGQSITKYVDENGTNFKTRDVFNWLGY